MRNSATHTQWLVKNQLSFSLFALLSFLRVLNVSVHVQQTSMEISHINYPSNNLSSYSFSIPFSL